MPLVIGIEVINLALDRLLRRRSNTMEALL
jgi:hypothetical protein